MSDVGQTARNERDSPATLVLRRAGKLLTRRVYSRTRDPQGRY